MSAITNFGGIMPFEKGHHPGTLWIKSDLQCHSPRDTNWTDPPSLPGGTPEFEAARAAWASSFIEACIQGTLGLVSITDPHDINFIPCVREAAKAQGIVSVLPGLAVPCSDRPQCLAIFDPA